MSLRGIVSLNLGNLSFLVMLDLKNYSFDAQFPKVLCRLRRLKVLHINYHEFEGGIHVILGNLSKLQYLYLYTNNFTSYIPESIGNLQWLKELDTSHNKLIPQTVSNIYLLKVLYLFSNCFSGTPTSDIMRRLSLFFTIYDLRNLILN
ncbi:putative non-specific serine/threonine protein kinase [Medicago truncatula]|uniref:Putative non-specific serine/threonine protein kinase n=1 Tax=Medicago truncatula TaxID=3880 RepID=A0A396GJ94_MEDTR|nr:putative non-specific serine/threonine protein kinase [Medicago truncatula]